MTYRKNGFGLGLALSLSSLSFLGFSSAALAQDGTLSAGTSFGVSADASAKPGDTPAPSADASASASAEATPPPAPATTETAPTTPPAETAPAATTEAPVEPPKVTEPEASADSTETTASKTSAARETTVSLVGIERLPGSAFPAVQTRGIKYGSLWLTFHGQQWPYMPLITGGPGLRIGVSGSLWNDLSNMRITADKSLASTNVNNQNRYTTQTRGVLRITPTYNNHGGWFVQGNTELVASGDQTPDPTTKILPTTDDLWVRVGKWDLFDITAGRFQGWEIANHYGMALDQNTLERSGALVENLRTQPTDGYGLTYFWERQNYTLGGYAVHFYPTKYLRTELLTHIGSGNNTSSPYQIDVRPSAIFDIGWMKLKAGWEYGNAIPRDVKAKVRDSRNGFGAAAQFVIAPYVEFGGSFARGFEDVLDKDGQADLESSNTAQTYGGFLNVSPGHEQLVLGFGAFQNHVENFRIDSNTGPHHGEVDTNEQLQLFGAAQYTFWDQLYVKLVVSHAKNEGRSYRDPIYVNNATGARLRVMLLF